MILKLNHLKVKAAATTQGVIEAVYALVEDGHIDQGQFARLQVELDWIQYKSNFREAVTATQGYNAFGQAAPSWTCTSTRARWSRKPCGRTAACDSSCPIRSGGDACRLPLEEFQSLRSSIVWDFNRFFWRHLLAWEASTGQGYDKALPGRLFRRPQSAGDRRRRRRIPGPSDVLRSKNQLPPEVNLLEIGVGNGSRCAQWLDKFQELDAKRGTGLYPRIRFYMGDYSEDTLNKARITVAKHIDQCRFVQVDAINPIKSLAHLRHKILQVHLTNVYDNLPDEEVVRRDGKLYFVQVRAYVPASLRRIGSGKYGIAPPELSGTACYQMLETGFDSFGGPRARCSLLAGAVGRHAAGGAPGAARRSARVSVSRRARCRQSSKTSCRTRPPIFVFT